MDAMPTNEMVIAPPQPEASKSKTEPSAIPTGLNINGKRSFSEVEASDVSSSSSPMPKRLRTGSEDFDQIFSRNHSVLCSTCEKNITTECRIICADPVCAAAGVHICIECFSAGKEVNSHKNSHDYRVEQNLRCLHPYDDKWGADEELLLLEGCTISGFMNWKDISEHVGNQKKEQHLSQHYSRCYLDAPDLLPRRPLVSPSNAPLSRSVSSSSLASASTPRPAGRGRPRKRKDSMSSTGASSTTSAAVDKTKSPLPGYMPLRDDFDVEHDNDAELVLADMAFDDSDHPTETELKIKIVQIYNRKLDERERRRKFVLERGLLEYKKLQLHEKRRPLEEREIYNQMRPFARFHSAEEHEAYIQGLIHESRLRTRIAQLLEYRRNGITTMAAVKEYELEKKRKETKRQLEKHRQSASYLFESGRSSQSKGDRDSRRLKRMGSSSSTDTPPPVTPTTPSEAEAPADESKSDGGDDSGFSVEGTPSVEKLSAKEKELCTALHIYPSNYLLIKTTLLAESFKRGHLKKETARHMIQINVQKTGKIYDFFVSSGWVTNPISMSNEGEDQEKK